MMKKYLLVFFVFAFHFSFSQEKKTQDSPSNNSTQEYIHHEVKMGETVALLYKKYLVNPSEIYKANEGISDGIVAGSILKIPITNDYRKKQEKKSIINNEIIAYK